MASIPNYMNSAGIQLAIARIKSPPSVHRVDNKGKQIFKPISYEFHVGSFAFTMVKNIFKDPEWVITPEMSDKFSNKKPDITIEKVKNGNLETYMIYELKSATGDRLEEALNQSITSIVETIDEKGQNDNEFETFIVVQRGLDIAFFEYHNDVTNLDEEGIPHFRGCVSLTYSGMNQTQVIQLPASLKKLFFDEKNLIKETDIRKEAEKYQIPCVFNLLDHGKEINFLFHHMATNNPRSSV